MENVKDKILVTWDFTEISEHALAHAVKISKVANNQISLIHIVKKKKEIEEMEEKMNSVCDEAFKKYGVRPEPIIKEGTIFTTIGETATEIGANLVIMGTHGIRGMQKLTGSWALKVIVSSKIPFIVVQEAPLNEKFENVVFPIDFRAENKEKLNWVNYLAKYYKLKLRIIRPLVTDEGFKAKINNNLLFAKKILDSIGIDYDITTAESSDIANETMKYAERINADLILIMTTKDIDIKDYVFGASEQKIIANPSKIPVMCINPRDDIRKFGGFN
jgi:nucleotide-binding universal stress UspA family protein